ncbi:MAG: PEGA domain-containing protein [Kofleriaceae bacterium]|nr:PEGA domain-containing protein [Kofleriaceae bacterium]
MRALLILLGLCWALPAWAGKTGQITIESDPPGASVYIGDKADGEKGVTPLTLDLPPGDYTFVVALPGYADEFKNVTVPRNKKPVTAKITLRKAMGMLTVSAKGNKGRDLDVYINDENRGRIPVTLELGADTYHIEIKRGKVTIRDERVTVAADQETELQVDPAAKSVKAPVKNPDPDPDTGGDDTSDEPTDAPTGEPTGASPASSGDGAAKVSSVAWLTAAATTTVMFREVGYTQVQTDNLFLFDQGGQLLVGVALEVFPFAKKTNLLRKLSVRGHGNVGVPQSFATADAQMLPVQTAYRQFGGDVHFQVPLSSLGVDINAGFEQQTLSFSGDDEALTLLPDAAIGSLRLGGGLTAKLGMLDAFAFAEVRVVTGGGPYVARFQGATGNGFGLGGGVRAKFGRMFATADLALNRYSWQFLPTPQYIAKTATDRLTMLNLGFGIGF